MALFLKRHLNKGNTSRFILVTLSICFCLSVAQHSLKAQVIEPASITQNQNSAAQTAAPTSVQPQTQTTAPTTESAAQQPAATQFEFIPPTADDFSSYKPQFDTAGDGLNQIVILVDSTPEYPGPYQDVQINIDSYTTKLDSNVISWFVDGKLITKGTGLKSFTTKTGAIGTQKAVTVSVLASNGYVTQQKITLSPAAVDLIWQAQSYTPPFYKGKALIPHQGAVVVSAEPTIYQAGKRVPPSQLIYKWKQEDTALPDQSGYGKNSVIIEPKLPLDAQKISVEVSTVDGKIKAGNYVRLTSQNPTVILYPEDTLTGIRSQQALMIGHSIQKDSRISAIPYFFSTTKRLSTSIQYNWSLNGQETSQHAPTITLGFGSQPKGDAYIQLEVKHATKIFQSTDTQLPISFDKI